MQNMKYIPGESHQSAKIDFVLRELIILFGYFNGLWIAVGINPENELVKALLSVISAFIELDPAGSSLFSPTIFLVFTVLPLVTVICCIGAIYRIGGILGLTAVGIAFIGGLLSTTNLTLSVIALIAGVFLGVIAVLINDE